MNDPPPHGSSPGPAFPSITLLMDDTVPADSNFRPMLIATSGVILDSAPSWPST
jgi:hypothetical protein